MLNHTPRKGEMVAYCEGQGKPVTILEIVAYKDDSRQIAHTRNWITGETDMIIVRFHDGSFNKFLSHYQDEHGVNYTTEPPMHT